MSVYWKPPQVARKGQSCNTRKLDAFQHAVETLVRLPGRPKAVEGSKVLGVRGASSEGSAAEIDSSSMPSLWADFCSDSLVA